MQVDLKDTTRVYYVTDSVSARFTGAEWEQVLLTKQYDCFERLITGDSRRKSEEKEMPEDAAIRECFERRVLCSRLNHLVSYNPSWITCSIDTHIPFIEFRGNR
jgi:hypothetical protein